MRILLDSCSFIHFLAAGEENILIQQAKAWSATLATCERVAAEVESVTHPVSGKAKFRNSGAQGRWHTMAPDVTQLSDLGEQNPDLDQAMSDLHEGDIKAGVSLATRLKDRKNLGEFIAVAHCLVLARQGHEVILIIDDGDGRRLARLAQNLLVRDGIDFKKMRILSTRQIVNRSEPGWRQEGRSVDETIAGMEQYGAIPDWTR